MNFKQFFSNSSWNYDIKENNPISILIKLILIYVEKIFDN